MLTQEEIRIKAGLDYSKVTAGLQTISTQVTKLAGEIPRKLGSILKATVANLAVELVSEISPIVNTILDKAFGIGPEATRRKQEAAKNLKELNDKKSEASTQLADETKRDQFERANNEEKLRLLDEQTKAEEHRARGAKNLSDELQAQKELLEKQIVSLREIAKEQEIIRGQMGQQFPAPTDRALQAGRDLRIAGGKLTDVTRQQIIAATTADQAATKASEYARQRDEFRASKFTDQSPYTPPATPASGEPLRWADSVRGKMDGYRISVDRRLKDWSEKGVWPRLPAPPPAVPQPQVPQQVIIVGIETR
jgi:hypothetical protein